MHGPSEVEVIIQELPEHFRRMKPLFDPKCSRYLHALVIRWQTLGPAAVIGGEWQLFGIRLPAFDPRQYDDAGLVALGQQTQTNWQAAEIFRKAVTDLLGRGELPPEIQPLATFLLTGTAQKKPGKNFEDNWIRDGCIYMAVKSLIGPGGFLPTRNRASRLRGSTQKESACSIVRKALAEAGISLSEDAVEKIWKNCRRRALLSASAPE